MRLSVAASSRPHGDVPIKVRALFAATRRRVYARLERALEHPIALVCAPAGYDRSTVVREFLEASATAHRYVEVDSLDGGLLGVLRALADALADVAPGLTSSFVTVYDRLAGAADVEEQLAIWTAAHLAEVHATIVVDGIPASGGVAAFVCALAQRTRASVRWLLIAETSESFPVARWLAEGALAVPVDAADLTIGTHELLRAARAERVLFRGRLAKLCALTGGWPAALALALATPSVPDPGMDGLDRAALYDRLADAALAALSERDRAFVEATCLFDRFDDALLECAGLFDARDTLAKLGDEFGILVRTSSGAYRYEQLFGEFLRRRLRARADDSFERLAVVAARALERDGRFAAAIAVHGERGDHRAVGALLASHGFALIDGGQSEAVHRALQSFPPDMLPAFPGALAVKASLESLHGKFDVAEAWFRLALGAVTDDAQRHAIAYRFGVDLVRRERFDAVELLMPIVCAMRQDAPLAAPFWALLATAFASHGRNADASLAIDRALRLLPAVTDRAVRAKIVFGAGYVALAMRDIEAAKRFALRAQREAAACFSFDLAARALSILYNIAVDHEDDVAAGRDYLAALADVSVRAGSRELLLYATLCSYELETLSGNVPAIARLNERLQSLDVFFSVLTTETLLPAQALQATWNGDFYRAYRLLEPSVEHQINVDRRAHRNAEIAVYAAAAGLRAQASAAVERALALVRGMDPGDRTVQQTFAFIALAFVLLRRHARAAKILGALQGQSAGSARVACFVRVVKSLSARWLPGGSAPSLSADLDALERCELGGLARMVEALPLPETARSRIARLSSFERDVLQRLCAGSTPEEIARQTARSLGAVEASTAAVCRKLGCIDRRHAVAVAIGEALLQADPRGLRTPETIGA